MKIAPRLKRFLNFASLPCSPNRRWTKESGELWSGADKELRALLAVARATQRHRPPRTWHKPGDCELCRALGRLERVSKGTP